MRFVPEGLTRSLGRSLLKAKANSPHIFFAGGVVGVVAGTALACRATLNLEKTIDEIRTDLADVKQLADVRKEGQTYVEQEHYKNLTAVYIHSAVKVGKLYGPSILVGGVSVAMLAGSHVQMTRRNSALTLTLATMTKAFEDYRSRVREELGQEKELDIYRGTTDQKIDIDGVKQLVKVKTENGLSPYARCYDENCREFTKHAETNRLKIRAVENYHNHLLQVRGHVFLNEVYKALGFDHSQLGQLVGWVLDGDGDGYVDFGIYEAYDTPNPYEPRIWLDFNVDGIIFDKIKE